MTCLVEDDAYHLHCWKKEKKMWIYASKAKLLLHGKLMEIQLECKYRYVYKKNLLVPLKIWIFDFCFLIKCLMEGVNHFLFNWIRIERSPADIMQRRQCKVFCMTTCHQSFILMNWYLLQHFSWAKYKHVWLDSCACWGNSY